MSAIILESAAKLLFRIHRVATTNFITLHFVTHKIYFTQISININIDIPCEFTCMLHFSILKSDFTQLLKCQIKYTLITLLN